MTEPLSPGMQLLENLKKERAAVGAQKPTGPSVPTAIDRGEVSGQGDLGYQYGHEAMVGGLANRLLFGNLPWIAEHLPAPQEPGMAPQALSGVPFSDKDIRPILKEMKRQEPAATERGSNIADQTLQALILSGLPTSWFNTLPKQAAAAGVTGAGISGAQDLADVARGDKPLSGDIFFDALQKGGLSLFSQLLGAAASKVISPRQSVLAKNTRDVTPEVREAYTKGADIAKPFGVPADPKQGIQIAADTLVPGARRSTLAGIGTELEQKVANAAANQGITPRLVEMKKSAQDSFNNKLKELGIRQEAADVPAGPLMDRPTYEVHGTNPDIEAARRTVAPIITASGAPASSPLAYEKGKELMQAQGRSSLSQAERDAAAANVAQTNEMYKTGSVRRDPRNAEPPLMDEHGNPLPPRRTDSTAPIGAAADISAQRQTAADISKRISEPFTAAQEAAKGQSTFDKWGPSLPLSLGTLTAPLSAMAAKSGMGGLAAAGTAGAGILGTAGMLANKAAQAAGERGMASLYMTNPAEFIRRAGMPSKTLPWTGAVAGMLAPDTWSLLSRRYQDIVGQ